jgi:hypothetical protein
MVHENLVRNEEIIGPTNCRSVGCDWLSRGMRRSDRRVLFSEAAGGRCGAPIGIRERATAGRVWPSATFKHRAEIIDAGPPIGGEKLGARQ